MAELRPRLVAAWVLAILLAISVLDSGYSKVTQAPEALAEFARYGQPPRFARYVGVLEVAGGVAVLIPALSMWGALVLLGVMFGAVYAHLSTGIGSVSSAAGLLVMAALLAWLRAPDAAFRRRQGKWD